MNIVYKKDYPFYYVAKRASDLIVTGKKVHQRLTCGGCKRSIILNETNVFYEMYFCECGANTNIKINGCNFRSE